MDLEVSRKELPGIFPLIVFFGVILLILRQPVIKIPKLNKLFQIDYGTAPLLGVILLLITLQISPSTLIVGIVGTPTIQPYMIIILFFSLAYVCISIDLTGFFSYLALSAAKKSGSSGKKLFFYFCLLSGVMTTFTSNDIVILTLTPIIVYFCKYTKTNPLPYLIGQFFMANIWSIALYVGNPTNIIVAQAYDLTFLGYSIWMVLPTVVAGVTCYILLYLVFQKELSTELSLPDIDPRTAIKDRFGAIFGVTLLACCLVLLSLAPILGWNMGLICFIFAMVFLIRDILHDSFRHANANHTSNPTDQGDLISAPQSQTRSTPMEALVRMPWKIMPFVFGMFILVESLSVSGWIGLFATSLGNIQNNAGLFGAVFIMCFLSSLTCNIMNNQPMTILFTEILQNSNFRASPVIIQASMFALIMGSNFGANFTLIGALAGIMWSSISAEKGVKITYKQFAKYGFAIMPLVVALASLVLALEFYLL